MSLDYLELDSLTHSEINNRHFGSTLPLGVDYHGNPKYLLGPHWYLFIITLLVTTIALIYITLVIYSIDKYHIGLTTLICSFMSTLYVYKYVLIGLSLPGLASTALYPMPIMKQNKKYCTPCKIVRYNGTKHCYECDVCIYEYDHHCIWVGKCIGRDNKDLFRSFLCTITFAFGVYIGSIFYIAS